MAEGKIYDCLIVGAGPGGLQAAIYLGRYNRDVLILDRSGGRTWHAKHIENFLTQKAISGKEIITLGIGQAESFGAKVEHAEVASISKTPEGIFEAVLKDGSKRLGRFAIVSTGVTDNLPPIDGVHKFLGISLYTCVDCDGYRTTGKKLVIIGNSIKTAHLAVAMKKMFTKDITMVLYFAQLPEEYIEGLQEEGIRLVMGRPVKFLGGEVLEGVEMKDGSAVPCEAVMSHFGYRLNDDFLAGLGLKRDSGGFKYVTSPNYESSLDGLYIVGPLNTGNDQAVIAAGEGATAAIEINKRLLSL